MQQDSGAAFLRSRAQGKYVATRQELGECGRWGDRRLDDGQRRQLRFESRIGEAPARARSGAVGGETFERDRNRVAAEGQWFDHAAVVQRPWRVRRIEELVDVF